jgi:hypothetical protein
MNPGGQGYFLSVRILPTLIVSSTTSYSTIATYPGEGTVFMFVPTIVGIDPDEQASLNARLLSTYPNPFHTDTTIAIDLRKDQNTLVNVYDVKGKLVKTLWNGHKAKGQYSLNWDGKDNSGNELPPGLYLLQTKQANQASITKLLKL